MKIDELWESSSKVSSQRDSVKKPKNRRWAHAKKENSMGSVLYDAVGVVSESKYV